MAREGTENPIPVGTVVRCSRAKGSCKIWLDGDQDNSFTFNNVAAHPVLVPCISIVGSVTVSEVKYERATEA